MPTRKELISSGAEVTPLTREEYFLKGEDIAPLNVKEKVLSNLKGGGGSSGLTTAKVTFVLTKEETV